MQTAYHGSPYKWNNVDLSKAGTGEGSAAFGHGLYAADLKDIAEYYKVRTEKPAFKALDSVSNKYIPDWAKSHIEQGGVAEIDNLISDFNRRISEEISKRETSLQPHFEDMRIANQRDTIAALEELKKTNDFSVERGHLYKLDIPSHDNLLDWDKPLSEQPEKVRGALSTLMDGMTWEKSEWPLRNYSLKDKNGNTIFWRPQPIEPQNMTGEDIYNVLIYSKDGKKEASEYLRSIGIPGHKYLDQGSREAGKGTYNYVIYDPEAVSVLEMTKNESIQELARRFA